MKITLKHLFALLILALFGYFLYVNWYQDKIADFESKHPFYLNLNTKLRVAGDYLIGKMLDLSDSGQSVYKNQIDPNINKVKTEIGNGVDVAKTKIDNVRTTLSGAEDTYNKAKEVIEKGKETIDSAQKTLNDATKSAVDIDKLGEGIMGSVNTGAMK
ncbi:MAG: hypothetical protein PHN31_01580 [Candidatus Gracilibacteria bacterium]|nr:hypothetical protein [Candidatus Gracilibacteria bacterium]